MHSRFPLRQPVLNRRGGSRAGAREPLRAAIEALEARRLLTTIASGERVFGSITGAGDSDSYTFSADAGDSIILTIGEESANWAPQLELFAPGGASLGVVSGSSAAGGTDLNHHIQLLDLAAGGIYTAVASGANSTSGNYFLSMLKVPGAQPFDEGPLVSGGQVSGTIERGDLDVFTFSANVGESLLFSIGEPANWAPRLEIYSPTGEQLDLVAGSSNAGATDLNQQIELLDVTEGGTFFAVVRGHGNSAGDYTLTMLRVPGAQPFDQGPLVSGGRVTGTINRGDLDIFSFDVNVGDSVLFSLGESANWAPRLDVFSPGGERVDFVNGSGSAGGTDLNQQLNLIDLTEDGTYFAVLRAHGNSAGDYIFSMLRLPGAQPFDRGPLVSGERVNDTLQRGDFEIYSFDAAVGESLLFSIGEAFNWAPRLEIYSPGGQLVNSVNGSSAAGATDFNQQIELLNVTEGGTYHAVVRANGNSAGEYFFTMLRVPGAQPLDDGPLLSNQRRFGTLDRGDLDVFSFEALEGESVVFSIGELFNWAPRLDVFAPSGIRLGTVSGSGAAGGTDANRSLDLLDLPESGTYYAVARGAGDSAGSYILSFARLPAAQATDMTDHDGGAIASGQTTTAAIAAGDLDVYTLTLAAGNSATIQMTRLTGSFTSRIDLFDPDGVRLDTQTGSPTATINLASAPQTGTYYILARTSSTGAVGNYSIAVDTTPGPDTRPPQVTASAFEWDAPRQRVVFTMNESVAASVEPADLTLENLTTSETIPTANISVSFNALSNQIVFEFPGYPFGVLPDGDYRATLNAGSVEDTAGNALPAGSSFEFFFLQGDANRDRRVNLADFNILATHFGRSLTFFSRADFNYDGQVNLQDFNILAARFGNTLAPPTMATQQQFLSGKPFASGDDEDDLIVSLDDPAARGAAAAV